MGDSADSQPSTTDQTISVAGWSVDPSTLSIRKDGVTARLEPLTMAVLIYLALRAGKTVSREELERELWGGQVVVYQALSNTIAKLRKAFEDDPNHPTIIETIPKVGYRLIAEVTGTTTEVPHPAFEPAPSDRARVWMRRPIWMGVSVVIGGLAVVVLVWLPYWLSPDGHVRTQTEATATADKPSIAVLPFKNMSGDPKQDYFADGMTEDLITDLAKLSGLFVISRDSTFAYKGTSINVKQVAQDLSVRYVLEGSVRRDDEEVRINAQLIDATTGGHLWAERYDRLLDDVFDVQDDVRQEVVNALAIHLTTEERKAQRRTETDSVEAYQAFLRARSELHLGESKENLANAITYSEKALQLDPSFTRVYGVLSEAYWHIFNAEKWELFDMSRQESLEKLKFHLAEAMKNPTSRGLQIYSRFLNWEGKFEEAIEAAEQAVALDPSDEAGYRGLGRALNRIGRPAEGLDVITKVRRFNPRGDDSGGYAYRISESLWLLGRYEEAELEILKYIERSGDEEWGSFLLGAIYGQLGRKEEAKAAIDKFNEIRARRGKVPYTLAKFDGWTSLSASVRKHWVESMRKAGMPPGD